MCEWIVFVIMAPRALERHSHDGRTKRIDAIGHVLHAKLFFRAATLFGLAMKTIECGSESLLVGGVGQHISRQLPRNELVVWHVLIDGGNHPIAIWPYVAIPIGLVAMGIGITRQVEPMGCDPLAKLGRSQQAIDVRFICATILRRHQPLHLIHFRQSTRQRQTCPPRKSCSIRSWLHSQ